MIENPFDLRGPEFLIFYLVLGIAVNLVLRFIQMCTEAPGNERPDAHLLEDPYLAAQLRGGPAEAIRVVLVSLMERGLLKSAGLGMIEAASKISPAVVKRPLEQAVLQAFDVPARIAYAFEDSNVKARCDEYESALSEAGLIASAQTYRDRAVWFALALTVLLGVSFYKLYLAWIRHRHNVVFLVILTIIFTFWAVKLFLKRRTRAGDDTIKSLKRVFERLTYSAPTLSADGATNELAYLAAVFGIAALPLATFPFIADLRRDPRFASVGGSGSGCAGSGCSGSSCSGGGCGGGGCGGGGCGGGGCGGCGG